MDYNTVLYYHTKEKKTHKHKQKRIHNEKTEERTITEKDNRYQRTENRKQTHAHARNARNCETSNLNVTGSACATENVIRRPRAALKKLMGLAQIIASSSWAIYNQQYMV